MTDHHPEAGQPPQSGEEQIVVVGPDGQPVGTIPASALPAGLTGGPDDTDGDGERHVTELVEQPAKVMRIGSMIRQLLEEVKAAPLDEASRNRLKEIHHWRPAWRPSSSRSWSGSRCPSPTRARLRRASCASPRRSSSDGSKASSTASRRRSTPSSCRPAVSWSRCARHCRACRPLSRRSRAFSRRWLPRSSRGRAARAGCTSSSYAASPATP